MTLTTSTEESAIAPEELEARFAYHPPKGDQGARYERIRSNAKQFAALIDALVPESREKSLAITSLEQAVMWANAAISRHDRLVVMGDMGDEIR